MPQIVSAVQTTSLVDFEDGAGGGKNTVVSTQYQATFGVSFSVVNVNTGAVTFPRIGETYNTDPGCSIAGGGNGGCGSGTTEGWVRGNGTIPGTTLYFDRPDPGVEPLTSMTHAALIGRYFLAYSAGTNANAVYLRVQYTTPTQQASFGLIDIDSLTEKWIIEARDATGALIGTQHADADSVNPVAGDGQIRFIEFDFRNTSQFISELRVQYVGSAGPGLGFDYFLTRTNINSDPLVDAGTDQTVEEGTPVVLTGTASNPDGDPLTYTWTQIGGTSVTLSGGNTLTPTFTAPTLPGGVGGSTTLTFELDVSDGTVTIKDMVQITVVQHNHPPVCDAGAGLAVAEGAPVSLSGANSYDPDGDSLTYLWTLTTGPLPNLLNGVTTNTSTLAFTAPAVTGNVGGNTAAHDAYTFTLAVSDGVASASCTVTVVVDNLNHPPVANAGNDQTVNEATAVMLDGSLQHGSRRRSAQLRLGTGQQWCAGGDPRRRPQRLTQLHRPIRQSWGRHTRICADRDRRLWWQQHRSGRHPCAKHQRSAELQTRQGQSSPALATQS
jgi:hypothetical protein